MRTFFLSFCSVTLVHTLSGDTWGGGRWWRCAWAWVGGMARCDRFQSSGGWGVGKARCSPVHCDGDSRSNIHTLFRRATLVVRVIACGYCRSSWTCAPSLSPHRIARGFGFTLNFNAQLIFLLACRKLLTWLRSTPLSIFLPFDQAMPAAHMAIGYIIAGSAVVHAIFHLIAGLTPGDQRIGWAGGFGGWTQAAVTGFVIATVMTTIIVTSLPSVRRKHFERFYQTHLVAAAVFFLLLIFHGMLAGALYTYKWIAAPVALYVIDRGLRTLQTHRGVVSLLPDDHTAMRMVSPSVARLALPRVFSWSPGQYAELRIPSLSRTQWHPFTIASAPHEEHMVFFIKSGGNWTEALVDHVRAAAGDLSGDRMGASPPTHLDIHVRGPFGAPAQHTGQYSRVLLIAGGVGVTPFLAVAKDADRVIKEVRAADAAAAAADPRRQSVASRMSTAESSRRSLRSAAVAEGADAGNGGGEAASGETTVAHLGRSFAYDGDSTGAAMLTEVVTTEAPTEAADLPGGTCSDLSSEIESNAGRTSEEWAVNDERAAVDDSGDDTDDSDGEREDAAYGAFAARHVSMARFLRSVTVSYAAMWVLLVRIGLLSLAATVHRVSMGASPGLTPYDATGLIIADLVLSTLFAAPVVGSVALEAAAAAKDLSFATAADDVALTVVSIVGVLLPVLALAGVAEDRSTPIGYIYALFLLPATVAAFGWRHTHILKRQLLVAPTRSGDIARLRAVDFLWTAPTVADDGWVVAEVAAIGDTVRLHRFGTREVAPEEAETDEEGSTGSSSSDWETRKLAAQTAAPADIESGGGGGDGGAGSRRGDCGFPDRARDTVSTRKPPAGGVSPSPRPSVDRRSSIGSLDSVALGRRLSLNYGRPAWGAVLSTLVAHSRSGSAVGVFVCGPVAMTDAVRDAARDAMRASRHRSRRAGGGAYGRNVRLTVRAENF